MNNIVLVGMPAVGKSTIGKDLAGKLNFTFNDTDNLITKGEGKNLSEIIEENGLNAFLETEKRYILSVNGEKEIIATGGSVVYSYDAMMHLSGRGKIVYLSLDHKTLEKRISSLSERGVVIENGRTFKELYDERTLLYEKYADITIKCENKSVEEIVAQIIEEILK